MSISISLANLHNQRYPIFNLINGKNIGFNCNRISCVIDQYFFLFFQIFDLPRFGIRYNDVDKKAVLTVPHVHKRKKLYNSMNEEESGNQMNVNGD